MQKTVSLYDVLGRYNPKTDVLTGRYIMRSREDGHRIVLWAFVSPEQAQKVFQGWARS